VFFTEYFDTILQQSSTKSQYNWTTLNINSTDSETVEMILNRASNRIFIQGGLKKRHKVHGTI